MCFKYARDSNLRFPRPPPLHCLRLQQNHVVQEGKRAECPFFFLFFCVLGTVFGSGDKMKWLGNGLLCEM